MRSFAKEILKNLVIGIMATIAVMTVVTLFAFALSWGGNYYEMFVPPLARGTIVASIATIPLFFLLAKFGEKIRNDLAEIRATSRR